MNQRTPFENTACSVARTLNIIGEWWTLLILRDIFYEIRRFSLLRDHLGISRKILTNRLTTLINNNIIRRKKYQENPVRYEYVLTHAGRDLFPIVIAILGWGDKWIHKNEDIPIQLFDDRNKIIDPLLINRNTREPIVYGKVHINLGSPVHEEEWNALMEVVNKSKTEKT